MQFSSDEPQERQGICNKSIYREPVICAERSTSETTLVGIVSSLPVVHSYTFTLDLIYQYYEELCALFPAFQSVARGGGALRSLLIVDSRFPTLPSKFGQYNWPALTKSQTNTLKARSTGT